MYDFMEYCLKRFYRSSGWNEENQYSNLCSWSRALLDFHTPRGLSLVMSKLPTPQFKPSYTLNALPTLNGSIGYLYTSKPLEIGTSATVDFQDMIDRFRIIVKQPSSNVKDYQVTPDYLLYGRMFFPGARLEAMYVRRISEHLQYLVTAVNSPRTLVSPQVAMQLQYDVGKWCSECSYTSDDGLLGLRALYNIGQPSATGQWSLGTEIYYGVLDKSGGLSTGFRYRTLPNSNAPPISFTYTLNPIVGHMSTSYVAKLSDELVMCSRYDFSIYSYESDLAFGFEYRTKNKTPTIETEVDEGMITLTADRTEKLEGLIKARWGFTKGLALMWEGRFKNTLFSLGLTADLRSTSPIRTIGLEVQYFS
ncbi:mitochondrial distribution and morphology protein 10 [Mucor mucedo]|uniref:mitochondrial distribution and morphology protein 10 n=1 Tax=Mucor mucedo TaxID=29922 RepID=UPI002220A3AA|nr:mitochondrial distribution and morphology protein 10 [Mucor mucedo]KAI7888676.1 mitochondrial distribution and morphology protein 10 [Mucor mucedo]